MNVLSIDIGGTHVKTALVNEGQTSAKKTFVTPLQDKAALDLLLTQIIQEYQNSADFTKIGFSVPGSVNEFGTVSFGGSVTSLHGVNLKKQYETQFSKEVFVENDAKAATIGEAVCGNLKEVRNGAAVILGTGVGVGLLLDGEVRKGPHHQAGEVSFLIQDRSVQGYESFVGMNLSAVRLVEKLADSMSIEKDGRLVFEALKTGEHQEAQEIFQTYCRGVAILCFNLQCLIDLEKIVIGGGISQQQLLVDTIYERYQEIFQVSPLISQTIPKITIEQAKYQADANLIGVAEGSQL